MNQSIISDQIEQIEDDCIFISNINEISLTSKVVEYQMMPNHNNLLTDHINVRSVRQIPLKIQPKEPPESPKEIKYFKSAINIRIPNTLMDQRKKQLQIPKCRISHRYKSEVQRARPKSALKKQRNNSFFKTEKSVRFRIDNHLKF
ncbi:unnamed protein product [Paramecium sonneborni]|uniref:Uncharacterized protein n=1 Tax=Paramecium sonneborni TaxID=65129 RepID=A0A8S1L6M8_9CILI|nr:unnamed protein product [Paramecium sonneborni]